MSETLSSGDAVVLIEHGDAVPPDTEPGTWVFEKATPDAEDATPLYIGPAAPPLDDGCLGQHWPDSPTCVEHVD